MSLTFMAKPNDREGNSCHIHLSARDAKEKPVMAGGREARPVPVRRALHRGLAGRAARADPVLRAEHQLLQALRAGQLRAHRGPLGGGQPHLCAAEDLTRLVDGAKLVRIAEAGHYPMIEQEEAFIEAVTAFLAGEEP